MNSFTSVINNKTLEDIRVKICIDMEIYDIVVYCTLFATGWWDGWSRLRL